MRSTGRAATSHAVRYMTQLGKHWSHKFEVVEDGATTTIALPFGPCRIEAAPESIAVTVEAADAETLARAQTVVANHLARFAFREPELALAWDA
jgi:hypothetical protein